MLFSVDYMFVTKTMTTTPNPGCQHVLNTNTNTIDDECKRARDADASRALGKLFFYFFFVVLNFIIITSYMTDNDKRPRPLTPTQGRHIPTA